MSDRSDGARVRLVPAEDTPSRQLPWLAEAYAALDGRGGAEPALATPADLLGVAGTRWPDSSVCFVTLPDGDPVGLLVAEFRRASPRGDASSATAVTIIHALAIRRADRNLGYGVEAVALLETGEGVARLYAPVPRTNGLALYFWLRAGYRPVFDKDDAEHSRDPLHLWMLRSKDVSGGSWGP